MYTVNHACSQPFIYGQPCTQSTIHINNHVHRDQVYTSTAPHALAHKHPITTYTITTYPITTYHACHKTQTKYLLTQQLLVYWLCVVVVCECDGVHAMVCVVVVCACHGVCCKFDAQASVHTHLLWIPNPLPKTPHPIHTPHKTHTHTEKKLSKKVKNHHVTYTVTTTGNKMALCIDMMRMHDEDGCILRVTPAR